MNAIEKNTTKILSKVYSNARIAEKASDVRMQALVAKIASKCIFRDGLIYRQGNDEKPIGWYDAIRGIGWMNAKGWKSAKNDPSIAIPDIEFDEINPAEYLAIETETEIM